MINVVEINVGSAKLRMAEDGLKRLSGVIDILMKNTPTGVLSQQEESWAARAAAEYCCIGAAACHLLADCIEELERSEGK